MTWYELLLFLHVVAAIVWLGAGLLIQILATRAERAGDAEGLRRAADDGAQLGNVLFIPASLSVVIFGLLLVADGPWTFGDLWVTLGLVGYAATFLTGILVMKPGAEKVAAVMERDGGMSDEALLETRKLLTKGRIDTVVLYLVVAVMILKPTGDDVGVLVVLAAATIGGVAYTLARLRALDASAGSTTAAAAPAAP